MRANRRRLRLLTATLAALTALVGTVIPAAASTGTGTGAGRTFPASRMLPSTLAHAAPGHTAQTPARLTTDTNAPCNRKPEKGHVQCFAVVRTPASHVITPDASGPPATALGPSDIQSAYNLPAGGGAGRTVAIVDAGDDASAESDLAAFRSYYGLSACTTANGCFEKVNQDGQQGSYPPDLGWGLEISLDLDAVSSACPACHILLVEANTATFSDIGAAENEAVTLGAKYISNSYGASEASGQTGYDQYYNHPGVAITVAAGDSGNGVEYPSASPYVTAVGGTTLTQDASVPRGWTETAWSSGGSGCSQYEPQPAFQKNIAALDAVCPDRATADVAADADPNTGLAVFDSDGQSGWLQVGGTSLASPLIAATYALAGTPVSGSYPNTYPYRAGASAGLFDITSGSNGSCGNLLCTAGPGWDGPTGMGTPDGVTAFSGGPAGTITGTVTSKATGKPIPGATLTATGGYTASTGTNGTYDLYVPAGSYTVTTHDFGYADQTQTGVQVTNGQATTDNVALTATPDTTLSGTVTDGSGHGWPLYAKITVAGSPLKPVYTSPYTGQYHVRLPQQASYTLQVTPVRSVGYEADTETVQIGTSSSRHNITLTADPQACTAPGYTWSYQGASTGFTGWQGSQPQDGWTVTDNAGSGQTWQFAPIPLTVSSDFDSLTPGGDSDYAWVDSSYWGDKNQDTSLVSPAVNLSGQTSPVIGFDTVSNWWGGTRPSVDLSTNGGQTWTTVWRLQPGVMPPVGPSYIQVPIPQAAGKAAVQVRFHFISHFKGGDGPPPYHFYYPGDGWALDNVYVGSRSCGPAVGGLVAGTVTDANTGSPLDGATVAGAAVSATSAVTPGDPGLPDGFYELFSPGTGSTSLTASYPVTAAGGHYSPARVTTDVAANKIIRQDFPLKAGRLTVTQDGVSVTEGLGESATAKVTYRNDGTAPVHVRLGARQTGSAPEAGKAHPRITSPGANPAGASSAASWVSIRQLPVKISRGVIVAYHGGQVYTVGGWLPTVHGAYQFLADGYVYDPYDPGGQQWTPIAPLPHGIAVAAGAFAGNELYVVGGAYMDDGYLHPSNAVYAYNPASNSWSQVASLPQSVVGAAAAVLGGKLYIIGGCTDFYTTGGCVRVLDSVYRYNPATNTWTRLAHYPAPVDEQACGGLHGEIVCAGGFGPHHANATLIYHPTSNTWSQGAQMPYANAQMGYGTANGKLIIVSGLTISGSQDTQTPQSVAYDPAANTWATLPDINPDYTSLLGGASCGFYYIGGYNFYNSTGSNYAGPMAKAEVLPGYNQCGTADDVPWLSENTPEFTVAPGQSVTVTVTMNSAKVTQPGAYDGQLFAVTDAPYLTQPVQTVMTVTPPHQWGGIIGTITDATTGQPISGPLGGATIQVCSYSTGSTCTPVHYTLKTDSKGHYTLWLDERDSPLQVIAAADGYIQQIRRITIRPGTATTINFALSRL